MLDSELNEQLKNAVNFVKTLLDEESDIIIDESDSDELSSITFKTTINDNSFHTFEPSNEVFKLAAVDGGSQRILNGGSFIIGGYRAGALLFHGDKILDSSTDQIPIVKIRSISFDNRKEIYSEIFQSLIGEPPNEYPRELMLLLQRLRTFEEWSVAQGLIEQLESGDMILMDGSLKASINKQDILFNRIMDKATEKGIHFVGISKRSTLRFNHAPLLRYVKWKGEELFGNNKHWFCEIPDEKGHSQLFGKRYIVKFQPNAPFVFRTDINRFDDSEPETIFGKIAQYCSDATYLGYPYPLAHIHNKVVINRSLSEDISYRLESIAIENGISNYNWEDLFRNFHDILDKNV
jgi:hypothetical protein